MVFSTGGGEGEGAIRCPKIAIDNGRNYCTVPDWGSRDCSLLWHSGKSRNKVGKSPGECHAKSGKEPPEAITLRNANRQSWHGFLPASENDLNGEQQNSHCAVAHQTPQLSLNIPHSIPRNARSSHLVIQPSPNFGART